jgi:hypothetical protein
MNATVSRHVEAHLGATEPHRAARIVLQLCLACGIGIAWQADAAPPAPAPSRYTLKQATVEPAPQRTGRYALRGRFAKAESAGELREGENFVLIGRFAKAGVGCSVGRIFQNGFEGP